MLFIIHAYESFYQGLHGIEDWACIECRDTEEAEEIGREMSSEVIMSYSETEGFIQAEVEHELQFDNELDEDELYEEIFKEHIEYEIYELKEEYQSLSEAGTSELVDTLNRKLAHDGNFKDILEEYCEK